MKDLKIIKKEVFKRRPVLKEIYEEFGSLKLAEYVKSAWKVPEQKPDEIFVGIISNHAKKIYGADVAVKIESQLLKKPLVSTIDHLGVWGHPIFVNADLIYSLHFGANELAISLATESVSLNNTSSWSGSVLWHDLGKLKRFSFFPDKLKTLPVFSAPVISKPKIEVFKKHFGKQAHRILSALNISENAQTFSEQGSLASFNLWQKVFPSAPELVYLPLETIVIDYLLQITKHQPNHCISKLIFSPQGKKLWTKYFSNEHTFMFWGIDGKHRRMKLSNMPDGDIGKLMQERKMYPSSPLCFMVLLCAGLACAGGFTQTTWLTEVKSKFINLLEDIKASKELINTVAGVPTKNFAESSLATLNIGGVNTQPTALDLLETGKDYYPDLVTLSKNITLKESLDLAMPEIYNVVCRNKKFEI
jgi:hypothetical protein